ncbi:MAG: hypothetical protein Q7T55_08350 [Solirubrobacteraceae bacterium]|nr:hypothetical protein [Solirubrobacteraceae bacterium]
MGRTIQTAFGQSFELERHLPSIGWKPKFRGRDGSGFDLVPDIGGDDFGIFAIFGLIILAVVLVLVIFPLLLFVAEVALLVALIIPVIVLALVLGIKQHTVLLRRSDGVVVDQRSVHGVVGTLRAGRALRAEAHAGAYR